MATSALWSSPSRAFSCGALDVALGCSWHPCCSWSLRYSPSARIWLSTLASTHLPLPFLLLAHLPLVGVVLPSRFSLEVFVCLAAVIAFGLDDMHHHRPRPKWLTSRVFAGALVAALVVTQLPQWPYSTKQESTLPTALRTAIPAGDPVTITYPYLRDCDSRNRWNGRWTAGTPFAYWEATRM